MIVTLEETKGYLRVDYDDDDELIESFIAAAEQLVAVSLYRDSAAGGGVFDSVVQQVAHRLRCPLGVKDAVTL